MGINYFQSNYYGEESTVVNNPKIAIVDILYLMIIASNLMQLFINRLLKSFIKSQKEVIRLIIKELYLLKENMKSSPRKGWWLIFIKKDYITNIDTNLLI